MPPCPINSMISSWGKAAATAVNAGGVGRGDESAVSVGIEACARRHLGHRPCGASAGIGPPHLGHWLKLDVSLIPIPEARMQRGYRKCVIKDSLCPFRRALDVAGN